MSASYWTEAIGWFSGLVLLATISRQVFTQWRTRSVEGVSHWLFAGQIIYWTNQSREQTTPGAVQGVPR